MPIMLRWPIAGTCIVVALAVTSPAAVAQGRSGRAPVTAVLEAPKDLRPLLTPRGSELRLVLTRYTADHALLITDYAGGTRNPCSPLPGSWSHSSRRA